jgi:hypothetical protein
MSLDPLSAGMDLASTVIQKIWPDKSAAEAQQLAVAVQLVQAQIDVNKIEAASPSVFVSGWRPFIGWVCGCACAWNWIGLSIVKAGLEVFGHPITLAPADLTEMMPVLLGMLGLGVLRTVEKVRGVAAV